MGICWGKERIFYRFPLAKSRCTIRRILVLKKQIRVSADVAEGGVDRRRKRKRGPRPGVVEICDMHEKLIRVQTHRFVERLTDSSWRDLSVVFWRGVDVLNAWQNV